ncbi:uncharacterized protein HGUI_01871 [Hanseniaspora guilliermondii]|uniref:BHLH domain-containing protein n=1 Tax=Hanseniaspora guilliermondii TaxID=56406 RepID=A0A1L0CXU2_9ASCO|nr:uncharacterized protein HGUI_01871 [Hanseniaspora guilliermondii]
MSFTTGKGGIFDQVNRFYSSGNNILVEQPSINNDEHDSPKHVGISHVKGMDSSKVSMKENTDNEINNFFDEISKYNSPKTSYAQFSNQIDQMSGISYEKQIHEKTEISSQDNEFSVYLDSLNVHSQYTNAMDDRMQVNHNTLGGQSNKRLSQDVIKYSPGISPTVEAAQPPQYTPYLQARNARYSKVNQNEKKVVKYSPNMKPLTTEKRSYKVILPSNTSLSTHTSNYDKRQLSGNGNYFQDAIHSDISTEGNYTISDTQLHKTTSNSSNFVEEKKVLRATESPVIKPLKKRVSNASITLKNDFNLDGVKPNIITEMNKQQEMNTNYDPLMNDNKKPSGKPQRTVKKKEVHKEAEKHRRERLNNALEDLNDIIPVEMKENDRFPSKASTVEHAADYIRYLIHELNRNNIDIKFSIPNETYHPKERKGSI